MKNSCKTVEPGESFGVFGGPFSHGFAVNGARSGMERVGAGNSSYKCMSGVEGDVNIATDGLL